MFSYRQFVTRSLVSSKMHQRYFGDIASCNGNVFAYTKTGNEKVSVSATQHTPNEWESLSRLPYSNTIQWYNEEVSMWINISVDKSEAVRPTDSPRTDIELVFNLPTPQLQF